MSFPRYPKYKPSGVEWLGDVPAHWTVRPLRSLGAAYGGLTGKTADDFTDDGPHTAYFVPFTNILNNTEIQPGRLDPVQVEPGDTQNEVRSGDLLFLMSSEDYEFLGYSSVVCRIPPRTFLNSFCKGFRPTVADANPSYLNYYCRSRFGRALISRLGFGFTRINLRTGALLSTPVLFPPLPEQRAIAAFLDRETAKIDGLVAEQQRLIELLKEKRQAVISHAVTKGLDPKAPMKPSGFEWLGDVPAHWAVMRLEHVAEFVWGKAHEPFVDDAGHHVCVTARFISTNGEAARYCTQSLAPARRGDILMVMSDLPNGRALARAFLVADGRSYAINQRVCAVRLLQGDPAYFAMQLDRNRRLLAEDDGANQTHLSNHDFTKLTVLVPPPAEQTAIGASVGDLRARFDALSTEAEAAITLLQERRSALISAAVTGQIDVRNAATTEAA